MSRIFATVWMLAVSAGFGVAQEQDLRRQRGETIAHSMCAQCHAVGVADRSTHPGAPAFRALEQRLDLDTFVERLREGLTSGHPDMPTFRFTRDDARALISYLRSIQ